GLAVAAGAEHGQLGLLGGGDECGRGPAVGDAARGGARGAAGDRPLDRRLLLLSGFGPEDLGVTADGAGVEIRRLPTGDDEQFGLQRRGVLGGRAQRRDGRLGAVDGGDHRGGGGGEHEGGPWGRGGGGW